MKTTLITPTRFALFALGALLPAGFALGQSATTPSTTTTARVGDTVQLSPFTVNTDADEGYYATNSVSGTRTRTALIDLPMPMTVFTEEFIKDIGSRDLVDVVSFASGITRGTGGGSAAGDGDTLGFTIRGQAAFLPTRNGFRRLRLVDPVTISRVEVLKGPASLLYGQVNPGGSINYITKRPVSDRQIYNFGVEMGSYSLYRGTGDINVPLIPKKLALRLVGSMEDSKDIQARYRAVTAVMNPSLTWWYMPNSTLTVEWESTKRHINAFRSNLPYSPRQDFLQQNYPIDRTWNTHASSDYNDTDIRIYTAELIHRFASWLTLRANYTAEVWYENVRQNGSNINIIPDAAGNPTNLLQPRSFSWGRRGSWDNYRQAELVNNFSWMGIDSQTIAGYQRAKEEFRQVLGTIAPPNTGISWNLRDPSTWILTAQNESMATNNPTSTGLHSANITSSTYFTNQLTMFKGKIHTLAGVRFDHFKQQGFNPPATNTSSSAKPAKSPQVGVLYQPLKGLSFYYSYSQSFAALFNAQARRRDGTTFFPGPQTGKGWDAGVKAELFDGKVAGAMSVFALENTDIVRQFAPQDAPDGSGTYIPTEQSGTDRSTGFETDLHFRPWKSTQITASYANTDAYVKSDDAGRATLPNGTIYFTRQGHRLSNAPKDVLSLWAKHDFGSFGELKSVYALGGARYASQRAFTETFNIINGVPTPPPDLHSYTVFDAGVGARYSMGKVRYTVALMLKNVADKIYLQDRLHYGAPRFLQFSLNASF